MSSAEVEKEKEIGEYDRLPNTMYGCKIGMF